VAVCLHSTKQYLQVKARTLTTQAVIIWHHHMRMYPKVSGLSQ